MKKFFIYTTALLCICAKSQAQLSLQQCYSLARDNYPLLKKLDLISKSSQYSLENAAKLYLPQLSINGQATYQSQTVSFKDALGSGTPAGITFPSISKDQYKIQAELSQTIYDGGNINNQRSYIKANEAVQEQNIEVALYAVRERINQIYFAILLMDEQLRQNGLRKADLQSAADKTAAALEFGTAFRSNLDELKAEIINVDMTAIEFKANRLAYLQMLGTLTGKQLDENTILEKPVFQQKQVAISRPELKLYDLQKSLYDVEEKKLKSDYMPKLSAFLQGAYGRPTLNIIDNKFGPWYIVGAKLNWNLGSLYTLKNNKLNLKINRQALDIDKETFLLNANLSMQQEQGDIAKYKALMEEDKKVVALRVSIKNAAEAQLANGVITTHDFISQVNAENIAQQSFILHQVQLLLAQYNLNHTSGN
jgi:outer membrane protein TolC